MNDRNPHAKIQRITPADQAQLLHKAAEQTADRAATVAHDPAAFEQLMAEARRYMAKAARLAERYDL